MCYILKVLIDLFYFYICRKIKLNSTQGMKTLMSTCLTVMPWRKFMGLYLVLWALTDFESYGDHTPTEYTEIIVFK